MHMTKQNMFSYESKIGPLTIAAKGDYVTGISFGRNHQTNAQETQIIKDAGVQISEYLSGKRKIFDLPLKFSGTDFQKSVWNILLEIPYGQTMTYGEIAKMAGRNKACRAVGMACNRNPIVIAIPCHRVVGIGGNLTGYGGGINIKGWLIGMESGAAC